MLLKDVKPPTISVIIPTLNEAGVLQDTIKNIRRAGEVEIIVVDGGSMDNTLSIAEDVADQVFSAPSSRGGQMDLGAERAKGEILLFLHADTCLPEGWDFKIRSVVASGKVGGAFNLSINSPKRFFSIVSFIANMRSRFLDITYGDQAIFVKRKAFISVGGFKSLPIFEDIDLWRRLKRYGKLILLKDVVYTSPRKWEGEGDIKTTLKNWLLIVLYYIGIPPERLYNLYYNKGR